MRSSVNPQRRGLIVGSAPGLDGLDQPGQSFGRALDAPLGVVHVHVGRGDVVRPREADLDLLRLVHTEEYLWKLDTGNLTAAEEQFGAVVTDDDIDERMANPPERYAAVIAPPDEFSDITTEAVRVSATQSLVRDAVVPELAAQEPGGLEGMLVDSPQDVTRVCVRHISTASVGEATEVLERLGDPPIERCLFLDDFPWNIAGAEQVGLQTMHVTDPVAAASALLERLL